MSIHSHLFYYLAIAISFPLPFLRGGWVLVAVAYHIGACDSYQSDVLASYILRKESALCNYQSATNIGTNDVR